MIGEKKCPKCGGNNPSNNNTCNHCGYSFSGRGNGVFTSSANNSYTTRTSIGGVNVYRTTSYGKQSNTPSNGIGRIILFIVIAFFAFNFIIPILFIFVALFSDADYNDEPYEDNKAVYTCNELCDGLYVQKNGMCVCDGGNIYYEDSGEIYHRSSGTAIDNYKRCDVFCESGVDDYDSFDCRCTDGTNIDRYGNYFYDLAEDIDDTIENWEISNSVYNSPVITVFCDSSFYDKCDDYKGVVNAVRIFNNLNIYYFDLGDMPVNSRKKLIFGNINTGYNYNNPYTFIMKNYDVVKSESGHMEMDELESFLTSAGVL